MISGFGVEQITLDPYPMSNQPIQTVTTSIQGAIAAIDYGLNDSDSAVRKLPGQA